MSIFNRNILRNKVEVFNDRSTSKDNNAYWWLRTPSDRNYTYPTIEGWGGELSRIGTPAEDEDIGVRPAVWIDLSKK